MGASAGIELKMDDMLGDTSGQAWGITPDVGAMNNMTMLDQINAAPNALDGGKSAGGLFGTNGGVGGTMQGVAAVASAAAGIYDAYNKKKYQDKVFGMEEKRVARETQRQDKQQASYDKVFG